MREDVKEAAERLHQELKEKFPKTKFSVRIDRYSMGEAINVFWTNGVASDKVDEVLKKYEDIHTDPTTAEILCGGNRYVHRHRTVMDEIREKVMEEVKERYPDFEGRQLQQDVWKKISATEFQDAKVHRLVSSSCFA